MKKKYEKPTIQMELFQLNENIAACQIEVTFSPEENACGGGFGEVSPFALRSNEEPPFADKESCYCYYTVITEAHFGNS